MFLIVFFLMTFFFLIISAIIKARLCLFLGFYLKKLFMGPQMQENYQLYLSFLIKCSGLIDEDSQAIAEQAQNALCMLFDEKVGPSQRILPFLGEILEEFASYIKVVQIDQFFEMIYEFTKTYQAYILENPQVFLNLLKIIVERAEEEYQEFKKDSSDENQILTTLWNTIRNIAEKPIFVQNFQENIEEILTPLFQHLEDDNNLPYENDILEYMVAVIKIRKQVTPLFWIVFKLFPKIFEKQKGMIWHLFEPLNQIIIHGKNVLNEDPETIKDLIKMLITGLNPTNIKANSANVSEAALLLQLAIQYLAISEELWQEIIIASLNKVKVAELSFLKARYKFFFLIIINLKNWRSNIMCFLDKF